DPPHRLVPTPLPRRRSPRRSRRRRAPARPLVVARLLLGRGPDPPGRRCVSPRCGDRIGCHTPAKDRPAAVAAVVAGWADTTARYGGRRTPHPWPGVPARVPVRLCGTTTGLRDDPFGHFPHAHSVVHGGALDPLERLWFGHAVCGHQRTLGALHDLAGLQL